MRKDDPLEPGGEGADIVQLRDALVCGEEGFLRRVFGKLRIAEMAIGDAIDHALEISYQMVEGIVSRRVIPRLCSPHPMLVS